MLLGRHAMLLFCAGVSCAAAGEVSGDVRALPVIDKHDIRFVPLSVGGERFQRRVKAMAQDNYGFVWLGTDDGLYRYDGYSLRHYNHDPNNPHSPSDNLVAVLFKDRAGLLWTGGGYGGLDRFDAAQDTFIHYRRDANDSRSSREWLTSSIYQDLAGSMWIGTGHGLDRLEVASGRFSQYPSPCE